VCCARPGEVDDAAKAEKLIRNLAQRLERDAPGVSKSIPEGLDEILTVSRLGLPAELRRSLACTNIIENMIRASRHPQREALEFALNGIALDCCGHARSQEGLRQACPKREGRLTSFTAALASQSSTERGTIPVMSHVERKSKYTKVAKLRDKSADSVVRACARVLLPLADRIETITYDNGKEFASHVEIATSLGSISYFATPNGPT
jgi:hypothetical protein